MTHSEFIRYLEQQIEYTEMAVEADYNHARNYSYNVICKDIYHQGKEERQIEKRAAARFHDGRAEGLRSKENALREVLQRALLLSVSPAPVDKPSDSA